MARMLRAPAPRGERGAVVVMTALLLPVLLLFCAVVVDLGMLRVARADAQAVADVVALDLARELDGREISAAYVAEVDAAADDSLARNDTVIGNDDHPPDLDVRLGELDAGGDFVALTSGVPTAVEVVANTGVDFAFAGLTGEPSGSTARSAVGVSSSSACFQLGSWAATVEPGAAAFFDDLLEQILGTSTVGLAGWDGLATSTLRLGDILAADAIAVGTVDGLLSVPSLTAGEMFLAMAEVLERDGALAQAEVLDAAAASAAGDVVIDAGDLLGLTTASDGALESRFNALDLLVGTAFLANGTNFLELHNLQASVPSVGVTDTEFTLIERPRRACNQDMAQTAQAHLTSTAKLLLNVPLLKDDTVNLKLTDAEGKSDGEVMLGLEVELAGAHGQLTGFSCDPDTFEAEVWTDLVTLLLAGTAYVEGKVKVDLLDLGIVEVSVRFGLDVEADGSRYADPTADIVGPVSYPPQEYGDPVPAGGDPIQLPYIGVSRVDGSLEIEPVVGVDADTLEDAVVPVLDSVMGLIEGEFDLVNPLIDKINAIVGPLSTGMGVSTAGADFFGLPYPSCQHPALRG